ncbi:MAG: YheV family putative metal-binding protein [Gammaproteobacteria bacterium]|nr:YheV family putative metal-binding protein [Gammaproteobacteria bacterium]
MSSQAGPKRFIAGAVCPRCGVQDRIRVFSLGGATHRDCVACGFSDVLEEAPADELPKGRLDAPRTAPPMKGQPLLFHPPKARRRDSGPNDSDVS